MYIINSNFVSVHNSLCTRYYTNYSPIIITIINTIYINIGIYRRLFKITAKKVPKTTIRCSTFNIINFYLTKIRTAFSII